MMRWELNRKLHYTLRIAASMCSIGHGCFGIITKPIWCNYFAVFGIGHTLSYQLMPVVGSVDILFGILILFYPLRIIPAWLVIWAFITALLRPLSGEPFSEFIERAGNYGAPLALLILLGASKNIRGWFTKIKPDASLSEKTILRLSFCLRVVAFLLILGHGGLNLVMKKGLVGQYAAIGFSNPEQTAQIVGMIEILVAFAVLIRPLRSMVLIVFLWKMASELFYPHHELFEWIERGGSYGVLLALWFVAERKIIFKWPIGTVSHA